MNKREAARLAKQLARIFEEGGKAPSRGEHPEDRAMRLKGIEEGKAQDAEVLKTHGPALAKLVTVYSDKAATDALEALREAFWTSDPPALSGGVSK